MQDLLGRWLGRCLNCKNSYHCFRKHLVPSVHVYNTSNLTLLQLKNFISNTSDTQWEIAAEEKKNAQFKRKEWNIQKEREANWEESGPLNDWTIVIEHLCYNITSFPLNTYIPSFPNKVEFLWSSGSQIIRQMCFVLVVINPNMFLIIPYWRNTASALSRGSTRWCIHSMELGSTFCLHTKLVMRTFDRWGSWCKGFNIEYNITKLTVCPYLPVR